MARDRVRPLRSEDFATSQHLEEEVFGRQGEALLGPDYVRPRCDCFQESCFLARDGEAPAGDLLLRALSL